MSYNFVSQAAILSKAGYAVDSSLSGSSILFQFCKEAEREVNVRTRYDWITNKSVVKANFVDAIGDVVSDLAAMKCLNYNSTGYTRTTTQTMLDYLKDTSDTKIKALADDKFKEVMGV